jgi:2-oxo-4-hydroxy-4-carboxy--5-ureidoimidazoline (OHCU) decarboxylase
VSLDQFSAKTAMSKRPGESVSGADKSGSDQVKMAKTEDSKGVVKKTGELQRHCLAITASATSSSHNDSVASMAPLFSF